VTADDLLGGPLDIEPSMVDGSYPLDVLFAVLGWIEERLQRLFDD
jgi:hypothetical protein